ncbi:hypothetical protein NDU88_009306 [Pleurodeles waltl]|uniref:Uncharacterized protein n=1 Tax=Pleurodeles waltl TaxID=8319 RepID=A0AAV7S0N0_PLEWA|nr:hypothetical protein NDU88_009306 [Pleurodeles waltl]
MCPDEHQREEGNEILKGELYEDEVKVCEVTGGSIFEEWIAKMKKDQELQDMKQWILSGVTGMEDGKPKFMKTYWECFASDSPLTSARISAINDTESCDKEELRGILHLLITTMKMELPELLMMDDLSKAELQMHCKEKGLNAGKRITKVDLQVAHCAYEKVRRMQFIPVQPEDDTQRRRMWTERRAWP